VAELQKLVDHIGITDGLTVVLNTLPGNELSTQVIARLSRFWRMDHGPQGYESAKGPK
jgi:hypothetical protein